MEIGAKIGKGKPIVDEKVPGTGETEMCNEIRREEIFTNCGNRGEF